MCAEGRTEQGEAAYTDGLDSPQILQKEENSVRFGRGFPKKHSRRMVWEQRDEWKIEPAQRGSVRFFWSEGNRSARIEEAFLG